jgi:hypothetical protein
MSRENLSPRSVCKLWVENPLINPRTNRSITKDGKVYKALEKECKEYQQKSRSISKSRTPYKGESPRKIGKKNSLRKSPCQEQPEKYKWIVGKGCHELIKRSPSPSPKVKNPLAFHTIEKSLAKEFDNEVYKELGKKIPTDIIKHGIMNYIPRMDKLFELSSGGSTVYSIVYNHYIVALDGSKRSYVECEKYIRKSEKRATEKRAPKSKLKIGRIFYIHYIDYKNSLKDIVYNYYKEKQYFSPNHLFLLQLQIKLDNKDQYYYFSEKYPNQLFIENTSEKEFNELKKLSSFRVNLVSISKEEYTKPVELQKVDIIDSHVFNLKNN